MYEIKVLLDLEQPEYVGCMTICNTSFKQANLKTRSNLTYIFMAEVFLHRVCSETLAPYKYSINANCFCEELSKDNFVAMNEKTFQWLSIQSRSSFSSGQVFMLEAVAQNPRNFYPCLSTRVYHIVSDYKVLVNFNTSAHLFPVIQHCLWNYLSTPSSVGWDLWTMQDLRASLGLDFCPK